MHEQHAQNRKELQDLIEAVAAQETYKAAEAKQVRAVRSGCYSLSLSMKRHAVRSLTQDVTAYLMHTGV